MTTELRRIQVRRGTASDWSTLNPVLAQGEFGFEHDTGVVKIGDGATAWNSLTGITGGGGGANLTFSRDATTVTVLSDSGTDAILPAATTSDAGVMSAADKTKLDGVATGATANSSDATLLNRANHTGTQLLATLSDVTITAANLNALDDAANTALHFHDADRARANHTGSQTASTISDFASVARAETEAELIAGSNITITPASSGATRTLTIASTGGGGASTIGKHSVWVAAGAMVPSDPNGADALGATALTSGRPRLVYMAFDNATAQYAEFYIAPPKKWDNGTITFKPYWAHPATTTNFGVAWGLQAVSLSDDDTIDAAFGTQVLVTDTGGTTSDLYIGSESAAVTIAGTPATEDMIVFRLGREVADAADTLAVKAYLLGVKVYFTTNAETDA